MKCCDPITDPQVSDNRHLIEYGKIHYRTRNPHACGGNSTVLMVYPDVNPDKIYCRCMNPNCNAPSKIRRLDALGDVVETSIAFEMELHYAPYWFPSTTE